MGFSVDLTRFDRRQLQHGRLPGDELWEANAVDETDGIDERQRWEALEPRPDDKVEHGRLAAFAQGTRLTHRQLTGVNHTQSAGTKCIPAQCYNEFNLGNLSVRYFIAE